MTNTVNELIKTVKTREEAETVVRELLTKYSSDTAWDMVATEARFSKQSPTETLRRSVSNLFSSFSTRR